MPSINFPSSPALNDVYAFGGKTWVYNGAAWALQVVPLTTANVTELTNLYFTDARARTAISVTGSGSYDNTTGVITVTGGVTSVGGASGTISNVQLASAVSSTGILTTSNVVEGTNLYHTTTRARGALLGINGITYGTSTGNIELSASGVSATTYGGTTQIPVLTVDTFGRITSASNITLTSGVSSVNGRTAAVVGLAETANALSQFAATTSAELAGVISDETGSGALVFGTSPAITTALTTPSTTFALVNTTATTVDFAGAGTTVNIGAVTGNTNIRNSLVVAGNLVVQGTTTTVSSTTLDVSDKNLTLAKGAADSATADGAGLTIDGAGATLNYVHATTAFTSSQDLDLASGKALKINNTSVLNGTTLGSGVVNSSLTSVGTIGTGTWQGTSIGTAYTDAKVTAVGGAVGAVSNVELAAGITSSGVLTTANVAEVTNLYYTQARFDTALGNKTTANVAEGSNLYFTNARSQAALTVTAGKASYVGGTLTVTAANVNVSTTAPSSPNIGDVWIDDDAKSFLYFNDGSSNQWVEQATGTFVGSGGGGVTVSDDVATNSTYYPTLATITSGTLSAAKVSTTKLTFNPSSGLLTSTDYNSSSDKRLKKGIKTVDSALTKVEALRGVSFTWKDSNTKAIGMIAQEVQDVLPDVVTTDDDGYLGIKYTNVIGVLVEAIKELKADFEAYKKTHP
jgi:hypothetical protein